MKKTTDLSGTSKGYKVFSVAILVVMVIFFLFPLYWIVTGSFKNKLEITARTPIWFPIEPTVENYARLFDNPAFLWLFNINFISAAAMILTCLPDGLRPGQEALHRPGRPVHHHHLRHGPAQAGHRHPSGPGDDQLLPSERYPLGRHPAHGGLALRRVPDEAVLRDHPDRDPGGGPGGRRG